MEFLKISKVELGWAEKALGDHPPSDAPRGSWVPGIHLRDPADLPPRPASGGGQTQAPAEQPARGRTGHWIYQVEANPWGGGWNGGRQGARWRGEGPRGNPTGVLGRGLQGRALRVRGFGGNSERLSGKTGVRGAGR